MAERLPALLWRLSEAGEPAVLCGRVHASEEAAAFERLLELGVLVHGERLTTWDCCETCDCGFPNREARWRDGEPFAACRIDCRRDERLAPDDLLTFTVSIPALVSETAAALPLAGAVEAVLAGVWRMGRLPYGRVLAAAPTRSAILQPGLAAALRAVDPEGPIVLLGPEVGKTHRAALAQAGIHHVALRDVAAPPDAVHPLGIEIALLPHGTAAKPRLVLWPRTLTVRLDGREGKLPARPFQLLDLLAQRHRDGDPIVSRAAIHDRIFSPTTSPDAVRGLVEELRKQLAKALGREDLRQDLLADLLARLADRHRRDAAARARLSLDDRLPHGEGLTLADTMAEDAGIGAWLGQPTDRFGALERRLDLERAGGALQAEDMALCAALARGDADAHATAGLSRTTAFRRVREMRLRLLAAGVPSAA